MLVEATGFCVSCSAESGGFRLCTTCGDKPAVVGGTQCNWCKRDSFLSANADELEQLMLEGMSLKSAILVIRNWNRPKCLCCGEPIPWGTRTNILCQRTKECRSARRRLRTLKEYFQRRRYRDPAQTALEQLKLELGK